MFFVARQRRVEPEAALCKPSNCNYRRPKNYRLVSSQTFKQQWLLNSGYVPSSYPVSIQVMTARYLQSVGYNRINWQRFSISKNEPGSIEVCEASVTTVGSLKATAIFFFDNKMGYLNSTHAITLSSSFPSAVRLSAVSLSTNYEIPPTPATLKSK